jgi:hypothetical protein
MTPGIPVPAKIVEVDGVGQDPKNPQHDSDVSQDPLGNPKRKV